MEGPTKAFCIGATDSGTGKTSLTLAVQPFEIGPYLSARGIIIPPRGVFPTISIPGCSLRKKPGHFISASALDKPLPWISLAVMAVYSAQSFIMAA